LPQEKVGGKTFDDLWPARGEIEFRNVSLRYRQGAPLILQGLNIRIAAGERCGIVGRTGAGKSSLVTCLFRLVDSTLLGGEIYLDGQDTNQVSLNTLRRGLAMIPQEPVLMEGTARKNLDPFEEFDDIDLNKALQSAYLSHVGLNSMVVGSGVALSAGEQQLLCFARVLLLRRRVIVMDEPTAAIDPQTDAKIQTLLRQSFHGASVLCVAHRLQTILDYDRILVMADGCVAEEGPADVLLKRSGSLLSQFHNAATDAPQETHDVEVSNLDCDQHGENSAAETAALLPGYVDSK
jgi:ABC-type multidrug transport system fused ATPase/permease subunit